MNAGGIKSRWSLECGGKQSAMPLFTRPSQVKAIYGFKMDKLQVSD